MTTKTTACGCGGSTVPIDAPAAKIPNWAKTLPEWDAIAPTGGAGSSGSSKVQVVDVVGDPSQPGIYIQLLKVAAGAQIAAHTHAGDRIACVLEGTWHFGYGEAFDAASLKTLPTGSIYTEPSRHPHFAATPDGDVVVAVTGIGPTDTIYVDPAQDPANAKD